MTIDEDDMAGLSRAERRKLKKEKRKLQNETERNEREARKRNKRIRNYAALILIILIAGWFFYVKSIPPKDAPIIAIEPERYNFGAVSQRNGVVSTTMTITNRGTEELVINNMDTSCGCTTASIVRNGTEGPMFSMAMHGTNPTGWSETIMPQESVQLKIYYDPNKHKSLRGTVTRSVTVYSNDPRNPGKEVIISANQVA